MEPATRDELTAVQMPPKLEKGAATERFQLVAPTTWFERLEEWRRKQPRIPSRAEAIRILVDQALDAQESRERKDRAE